MSDVFLKVPNDGEPTIKPFLVECKFTVECREGLGGDWAKNTGGATSEKRITFDGYATDTLYATLAESIKEVLRHDTD